MLHIPFAFMSITEQNVKDAFYQIFGVHMIDQIISNDVNEDLKHKEFFIFFKQTIWQQLDELLQRMVDEDYIYIKYGESNNQLWRLVIAPPPPE